MPVLRPSGGLPDDLCSFWSRRAACRTIFARFGAGGRPAGRSLPVLEPADGLPDDLCPFWSRRAACRT
ncbi:hypothetical protein, partial [Parabacteroides sp.]